VTRYDCRSDHPRIVERLRSLSGEGFPAAAIAERLYAKGFWPGPILPRWDRTRKGMSSADALNDGIPRYDQHSEVELGR
jgi:hypothetical protein